MKGERPWFAGEADGSGPGGTKRHTPAAARNRDAIAEVLARELPPSGLVLEVASGSGEHAVYFARRFPALTWQPSDADAVSCASIAAWSAEAELANLQAPVALDAMTADWPVRQADAILCVNMVHISPWDATLGLLDGARRLLPRGAPLILYGPFLKADIETAPSNLAFDQNLRARDPCFGIRAVETLDAAAAERGMERSALHTMPANNLMLVYRPS